MVVYGSVSLVISLVNVFKWIFCPNKKRTKEKSSFTNDQDDPSPLNLCANFVEAILNLFLFIWLIIGSVWVLGKYDDWDDANRPDCDDVTVNRNSYNNGTYEYLYDNCCHEGTFLFAFIFIIIMWSLGFLIICSVCSCICMMLVFVGAGAAQHI